MLMWRQTDYMITPESISCKYKKKMKKADIIVTAALFQIESLFAGYHTPFEQTCFLPVVDFTSSSWLPLGNVMLLQWMEDVMRASIHIQMRCEARVKFTFLCASSLFLIRHLASFQFTGVFW